VLDAGVARGEIKPGIDPLHLYISMSALSYFYFSNSATLSVAFARQLNSAAERAFRRTHAVDVIMAFVKAA
jgi:hypothetical protein